MAAATEDMASLYYTCYRNGELLSSQTKLLASFDWTNLNLALPLTQSLRAGGWSALTGLSLPFPESITGQGGMVSICLVQT